MARAAELKSTFTKLFQHKWVWLAQLLGQAAILALCAVWLALPDSGAGYLILTIVLAVVVTVAVVMLDGGTVNAFGEVPNPVRAALRNILPVLVWAAIFYFVFRQVDRLEAYRYELPGWLRSEMPLWMRQHVSESALSDAFDALVFTCRWIIIPVLLLPIFSSVAAVGFRGFVHRREWRNRVSSISYWLAIVIAAVLGVYATGKIMGATPDFDKSTYASEWTSLILRFGASYLIAVFAWVMALAVAARRNSEKAQGAAA